MNIPKSQHFVPKFYLKNFSFNNDRKSVSVYVLNDDKYIPHASIAKQACSDFFYGKDPSVEHALGQIEKHAAPIIRGVIQNNTVPQIYSSSHLVLLTFILSLSIRTEFQAEAFNESSDKLFKIAYKNQSEVKGKESSFYIHNDSAPIIALHSLEPSIRLSFDLGYKILVNKTDVCFITSDNPVIKHNEYLLNDKDMSHLGFASTGLQLLLPLNPIICLIFFDRNVYGVGNKEDLIVPITDKEQINCINEFEYINANRTLYFNENIDKKYAKRLVEKTNIFRSQNKTELREYEMPPKSPNATRSIIHIHPSLTLKHLDIPQIRILRKARRELKSKNYSLYRDMKLAGQILDEYEAKYHTIY